MKLILRKVLILLIICSSFCMIGCKQKEVYKVNAISGITTEYTEFDKWLLETVGVTATPSFIFIKNNKVTNHVDYTINYFEFDCERRYNKLEIDLWPESLKDIDGNDIYLKDFDVIFVVRPGCKSCAEQEELYQETIYDKNTNLKFLIYHIITDELDCSDGCD